MCVKKYGNIAFDARQKAVLTSCILKHQTKSSVLSCCFSFTIRRDKYNMQVYCIDTLSFLQEAHMLFSVDRYDAHQLQISRRLFLVLVAHTDTCRLSLLEIFCLSSCSHDMFGPLRTRRYNYIYLYIRKKRRKRSTKQHRTRRKKKKQTNTRESKIFLWTPSFA